MNAPIKALGAMLLASAVSRAKSNTSRINRTREEIADDHRAIREAAERKFQEEAEQRAIARQSRINRLKLVKDTEQSEHQKDHNDAVTNREWKL